MKTEEQHVEGEEEEEDWDQVMFDVAVSECPNKYSA